MTTLSFFIIMFHLLTQLAKDVEHIGPSDQPFLRQHKKVSPPLISVRTIPSDSAELLKDPLNAALHLIAIS